MSKKYTPITVTIVILAIVAVIGYTLPKEEEPIPQRVLFENTAGNVVFDHILHAETYNISCETCHHESDQPREDVQKCGACHGVDFEKNHFKEHHTKTFNDLDACVTCHHMELKPAKWDHHIHATEYGLSCQDCHHNDTDIEPEPQNCANCHQGTGDEVIPGIKEAVHVKCAACHQEKFESASGCTYCHPQVSTRKVLQQTGNITISPNFASCSVCHIDKKAQELILGRMAAFHGQCIGCHEKLGKGPFKQDQCNQCHIK